MMLGQPQQSSGIHMETACEGAAASKPISRKPCRWRRTRGIALGVVLLACIWLSHPAMLRAVARALIVDHGQGRLDYVWIRTNDTPFCDGDRCYDHAARLYHEDTSRRILLMEPRASRLVEIGALPHFETVARSQLQARGVPDKAITAIDGEPATIWDEAHLVDAWMQEHPSAEVLLLCDRLESRHRRQVLDTVLEPDHAARLRVLALPDRRYDETNWWKTRRGVKSVFCGYVLLAYAWCQGEDAPEREYWGPDEYEWTLQVAVEEGG